MVRLGRLVIPGLPPPVTRRGNGPASIFFGDADYEAYRDWNSGFTLDMPRSIVLIVVGHLT